MASMPSTPTTTPTVTPPTPPVRIKDGVPIFPKGAKIVTAHAGNFFCRFAAEQGFRDCKDFRQINTHLKDKAVLDEGDKVVIPNKTEKDTESPDKTVVKCKRVEYRPGSVKFLGLGMPVGEPRSGGLTRLGISNFITDKANKTAHGTEFSFYVGKGADTLDTMTPPEGRTHADPDHFRVEVHDVVAGAKNVAKVNVELQVLQPLYKRDTVGGKTKIVRDKTSRPDPDCPPGFKIPTNAKRKVTIECFRSTSKPNVYRSKYLRLVTHEGDDIAGQTLFVGDYYDDGAGNDEKRYTEILEQKVRARYTPMMCDPAKCRAQALADVGEFKREARLAVHIMDNACSLEDVRRVVYKQVRRAYAQAGLRPHIKAIYRHPAPKNILTIGTRSGSGFSASGAIRAVKTVFGTSKVTVKVDGKTIEYQPGRDAAIATVTAGVAAAIQAQGLFTRILVHTPNPPPVPPAQPSRDILIFKDAAHTQYSEITSVTSDDSRLSATFTPLTSAILGAFPQDDTKQEHRLLKACCETEWFDAIVIKSFEVIVTPTSTSTLFGIATWIHLPFGPCIIVESARMKPAQDERYTFAHEMGHCLVYSGHCITAAEKEQLMVMGAHAAGNAYDMPGRRRIMDIPMKIKYQVFDAGAAYKGLQELGPGSTYGTAASRVSAFVAGDPAGAPTDREPAAEW
jgi:hypothetical protein